MSEVGVDAPGLIAGLDRPSLPEPAAAVPRLSVVAPCFNEEQNLQELWRRLSGACRSSVAEDYEIVLVDDGSRDTTWQSIERLSTSDPHVLGVRLFRNHGHQLAVTAGLAVTRGERVMLIDADLQDPPELLGAMMAIIDQGADVVYGQRISRAGESRFKKACAALFYRFLGRLSTVNIPVDTGDFRLMTRPVVDFLGLMPERHRFIRGMVSWIGGVQRPLAYEREARYAGKSSYPLAKAVALAVDGVTSFSLVPLRLAVWLGLVVSGLAFLLLLYAVCRWATNAVVPGWASSLVAMSFFAGAQLFVLGVIGEYLGRLVESTRGRPLFMIGALSRGDAHFAVPGDFSSYAPTRQQAIMAKLIAVSDGVSSAADANAARTS